MVFFHDVKVMVLFVIRIRVLLRTLGSINDSLQPRINGKPESDGQKRIDEHHVFGQGGSCQKRGDQQRTHHHDQYADEKRSCSYHVHSLRFVELT